ncbi:hypothetical protein MYX04_05765 [Nitrospiraceae bacterium AH_259_D15_M11_P09]|nr:hypothetical protein [Nitrospiraceae bacterium AH_259_D15_M11_P09]
MKCGERGFKTKTGQPCKFNISDAANGCKYHLLGPKGRSLLASKGPAARRLRRLLPANYEVPAFDNRESVQRFAQDLARKVLTTPCDPRRIDTALRAAGVALSALAAATQEKLVDALLCIEHGGAAVLLLTRLQDGLKQGTRRPLPGRVVTIPQGEAS